jgi:hypothetical protein
MKSWTLTSSGVPFSRQPWGRPCVPSAPTPWVTQTSRGPQQWLHRIAARCRLNKPLEIAQERWIFQYFLLSPSALFADTPW